MPDPSEIHAKRQPDDPRQPRPESREWATGVTAAIGLSLIVGLIVLAILFLIALHSVD